MTAIEQFNPVEWLSQFAPGIERIDYQTLEPILSFTLMWNLFETVVCSRNASDRAIRQSVNRAYDAGLLKHEDFGDFLAFFRKRYVEDGNIEELPGRLLSSRGSTSREQAHIVLLEDVLKGESTDVHNVVFSLLFIAYRIRNNLFHGEKNVFTLNTQVELFKAVNALLGRYLQVVHPGIHG